MLKRILVVDDEKEVCTFFFYFLRKKGYQVTTVQTGREALEIINKEKFHLTLLDLKMPDLDGLTLLKQIKVRLGHCHVIIMTGYSTVKSAIAAMQNGAMDYIEKPFDDLDELERVIDGALSTRSYAEDDDLHELATESGIILGHNQQMLQLIGLTRLIKQIFCLADQTFCPVGGISIRKPNL